MSFAAVPANASSEKHSSKAAALAQQGNTAAAIIELKNAVKDDPGNLGLRYDLSMLYIRSGEIGAATQELENLQRRGYDAGKVLMPLAQAYLALGRFNDVITKIDPARVTGDAHAGVLAMRARAYLALKDTNNARTTIAQALAEQPKNPQALIASATLLRSEGKLAEAEAQIDQALAVPAPPDEVLIMKGDLRRSQKDDAGAMKAYSAVIAKSPDHRGARLGRATTHLLSGRDAQASEDIANVLAHDPKNPMGLYLRALLLTHDKKYAEATQILTSVPELLENYPPALYLLASSAFAAGQLELALTYAGQYTAKRPGNVIGTKLQAAILMRMGMASKAVAVLEPIVSRVPDDTQLKTQLGSAYLAAGRSADAVKLLQEGVAADPDNVAARYSLALGEMQSGATEEGIAQLEAVVQAKPDAIEANNMLVLAQIKSGQTQKAMETATALIKAKPDDPQAYNLQATVFLAMQDKAGARKAYQTAIEKSPTFVPAMLNLGFLDEAAENRAGARQWYNKAIAADPKSIAGYEKLADLELKDKHVPEATKALEQAVARDPKAAGVRVRLVQIYVQSNDKSRALMAARAFVDAMPQNPQALDVLAQAQLANADYVNAIGSYKQLVNRFPNEPEVRHRLGKTAMTAALNSKTGAEGYAAEARGAFDKALELAPDNLVLLKDRLELEFRTKGGDAAVELAKKLSAARPQSAQRLTALGISQDANHKPSEAIESYRAAWNLSPTPQTTRQLYDAFMRTDQAFVAQTVLEMELGKNPKDTASRFLLTSHYISAGKSEEALRETEALNEILPKNPIILNNLAWLYRDKNREKAITYGEQAYALAPNSSQVLDTLGWLYVTGGNVGKGGDLLARAHAADPARPGITYRYAAALEKGGDSRKAKSILQKLLADKAPFEERQEAQALLTKIGG